jgi:hypothetical protein
MTDQKEGTPTERIHLALGSDVPRIYFNGFVNGFSAGDIMCVLERNGQPVGIMNMSYTVAKTLSASLATLVGRLEETSKQPIMTTHEVGKFLEVPWEAPKEKPKQTSARKKKSA